MSKVQKLSILYQQFLRQYEDHGFFSALMDRLTDLRKEYTDLCKAFLEKNKESCMGPLLFKAFALVDTKTAGAEVAMAAVHGVRHCHSSTPRCARHDTAATCLPWRELHNLRKRSIA